MNDPLGKLVTFAAIAAIGIFLLAMWQRAQAQNAAQQAELVTRKNYAGMEGMFAQSLNSFLFNR